MPKDKQRHVGDLGNIETNVISIGFDKTRNVVGLPLMIHNLTDDGGHTGKGESNTTGYVFIYWIVTFFIAIFIEFSEMLVLA